MQYQYCKTVNGDVHCPWLRIEELEPNYNISENLKPVPFTG
jgi:hypothetical protein